METVVTFQDEYKLVVLAHFAFRVHRVVFNNSALRWTGVSRPPIEIRMASRYPSTYGREYCERVREGGSNRGFQSRRLSPFDSPRFDIHNASPFPRFRRFSLSAPRRSFFSRKSLSHFTPESFPLIHRKRYYLLSRYYLRLRHAAVKVSLWIIATKGELCKYLTKKAIFSFAI